VQHAAREEERDGDQERRDVDEQIGPEPISDAHDDAALDLAVGADRVQPASRLVHRRHLQHPHDARLAIDLAAHRVCDEGGCEERLRSQPAGASGRV
jgi:hypothetical protein